MSQRIPPGVPSGLHDAHPDFQRIAERVMRHDIPSMQAAQFLKLRQVGAQEI
ncbi:hypothetical protein [Bacteroides eggerthii]|uniref:hypothetical protein n=1 Tax=Bacteroides eggerthii TaxID=28111 RepID=UPI002097CE57|nr:hypothetical protein [Bacteroides eggerthii]MCO7157403.1 hypothetical protein [Bacteroides eggerthii]